MVFLGGGSLRLVPVIRGIFQRTPEVFRGGSIRLVDLKIERAEAVGKTILACPEFQDVECPVTWTSELETALPGADVLYLTMAARQEPTETLAAFLASDYNYISSDNVSINGAFLSVRLGGTILKIARKMEQYCPKALMLIFPNPVSVYSCMVNHYTGIRALGICGGFNNHRWDLSRICGHDHPDPGWHVVAAGINHLSFILRGSFQGDDIFELFDRTLTDDWKSMNITSNPAAGRSIAALVEIYRRYRQLIFSTEGDGMYHILYEQALAQRKSFCEEKRKYFNPESEGAKQRKQVEENYKRFIAAAVTGEIDWDAPEYRADLQDITLPIVRALCGIEKMRIVASRPNYGAVTGFDADTALEYTMDLFEDKIVPVKNQFVPHPFKGLVASLAEFQTLLAEALATNDPRRFADALEAYPMNRGLASRREFFRRMFELYSDIDPQIQKAAAFFR